MTMGPGKGILGHGAGHGVAVENGLWAEAGRPAIFGRGWGFAPIPLGTAQEGEEVASLRGIRGRSWVRGGV